MAVNHWVGGSSPSGGAKVRKNLNPTAKVVKGEAFRSMPIEFADVPHRFKTKSARRS